MKKHAYPSFPFTYTYPLYCYPPSLLYTTRNPFPPVDISIFKQSLATMPQVLDDVRLFINKMNTKQGLAYKIKDAAQHSNTKEVEKLIKSTGVQSDIEASFTPDNIRILFVYKNGELDCCHITLAIRW
ncbi:hypothetical protein [Bacillus sp. CGMCC 1.16541]|uniref:hypothetical protein n=1 Tax=Bacillus sp. CGMCC 1.16541 TaxID=2185143 RepID=UPI000D72E7E9|nr:hypothetical protein [Bacillus sp. CGMCC 1.16541]